MNGLIIFGLLVVLMLTGMPISIALGLTVLSFIFGFTDVPLQSVALQPVPPRMSYHHLRRTFKARPVDHG